MAKQALAAERRRLWVFGQSWDFQAVTSTVAMAAANYRTAGGVMVRKPKRAIVLHATLGNSAASGVLNYWNTQNLMPPVPTGTGAQWLVERSSSAQQARPAPVGPAPDNTDVGLVDAVRFIDDEAVVYHGNSANDFSIGIEIANVTDLWFNTNLANEPSLAGGHALAACPAQVMVDGHAHCNHARPQDENRFIRVGALATGVDPSFGDFQALEEQQYMTLILLLRHLCITHRIARQFLGHSTEEVFRHWYHSPAGAGANAAMKRANQKAISKFSGIFHHRNVHATKGCPGFMHRNRLYRGIIDEWWMPVDVDDSPRLYYSGPFNPPAFRAGAATQNAYFRAGPRGVIQGVTYRNCSVDDLLESRSYYDLDSVGEYYAMTEGPRGGGFPMGINKMWHGGVHLHVTEDAPCVYAAASGTIVAARVSSHPDTEKHEKFGSQRFVLIRHAVYHQRRNDPGGVGEQIDYSVNPTFVFTLYMHLAPIANIAAVDDANPPWFNMWRAANAGVDVGMTADKEKGKVFAPDIRVSVGDILGAAGMFRTKRMIHFEVLSHRNREIVLPLFYRELRGEDTNEDLICDVEVLKKYMAKAGQDYEDPLPAAPQLRGSRVMHKSEWAMDKEDQIKPLVPSAARRKALWPHFKRFTWVAEAFAADAALPKPRLTELGDAKGMFWHYHPITFMQDINKMILAENREVPEEEDHDINVETSDEYYLTNFITWNGARFVPANVDNARVHPNFDYQMDFTRQDIACSQPGAHNPGPTPAQGTKFSLALLALLERIRAHFNKPINIALSYVCDGHGRNPLALAKAHDARFHGPEVKVDLCGTQSVDQVWKHMSGVAVDFYPAVRNPGNCAELWNSVVTLAGAYDSLCFNLCGGPTEAKLPDGFLGVDYQAYPSEAQRKLNNVPPLALDPNLDEVKKFGIHMELVNRQVTLRVIIESVKCLDDQDWFAAGEWTLEASVNGAAAGAMPMRSVNTGDTIKLGGATWTREVAMDRKSGASLTIVMSGKDEDLIFDDSLGTATLSFNRRSNWGIGKQEATSSNGSFKMFVTIQKI